MNLNLLWPRVCFGGVKAVGRRANLRASGLVRLAVPLVLGILWPASTFSAWLTITPAQGLPNAELHAIREDASGDFWFGTFSRGAHRFDGANWNGFLTDSTDAYINAIWDDRSGNLWFGTYYSGVIRFDGRAWHRYTNTARFKLTSNRVDAIWEDRVGNLWFGTGPYSGFKGGVTRYDPATDTWHSVLQSLDYSITAIREDRSGYIWLGTEQSGVLRHDPRSNQTTPPYSTSSTSNGLASNAVRGIAEDAAGNLWFATAAGLSRYNGSDWRTWTVDDGLPSNDCMAVHVDRGGRLWIATNGAGVARFDGVDWKPYSTTNGLVHNLVRTIYEDHSGNLWFGTNRGASRYHEEERWTFFTPLSTAGGLAGTNVTAAHADRAGNLWFASPGLGVSRYDGTEWRTFTTSDSLASNHLRTIHSDRSGNIWFGTVGAGVSRFTPTTGSWRTFTAQSTDSGLAGDDVSTILEDHSGILWLGTNGGGVSRHDPALNTWTRYTTAEGLASNFVSSIIEDRSHGRWFGTTAGVSRHTDEGWKTYTARTNGGLPSDEVSCLFLDQAGRIWAGTTGSGIGRYDPDTNQWTAFNQSNTQGRLVHDYVTAFHEDKRGNLWVATFGGVSRYAGEDWRSVSSGGTSPAENLLGKRINVVLEDGFGSIWFATYEVGARRYEPDQVAPGVVFRSVPPSPASTRSQKAAASVIFDGARGNEFSFRLGNGPWSAWSEDSTWLGQDLGDGFHDLEVRARDGAGNIDASPAKARFEVDATRPSPRITSPALGQVLRDVVVIFGSVSDARFKEYRVEMRPFGAASWDPPEGILLARSTTASFAESLATWRTGDFPDGHYDLRAWVVDSLGLDGDDPVSVVVDNHAPWANETAPVTVSASSGGDLYTQDGAVRIYFPPHAFERDALIEIEPLASDEAPDTLGEAFRIHSGFRISWSGSSLNKPATLELPLGSAGQASASGVPAVYVSRTPNWTGARRVGGTVDARSGRICLTVIEQGGYAVYWDHGGTLAPRRNLSSLSMTPRVFSPRGTYGDQRVGIGFVLDRPGPVTVKVYSRTGRIVRDVASSLDLNAGANLIFWDGRDREGHIVKDGLYYVVVDAMGQVQTKAVAVVK